MNNYRRLLGLSCAVCLVLIQSGCVRNGLDYQSLRMWNDSRLKPMEEAPGQRYGSSSRLPPEGAVARGSLSSADPLVSGRRNGLLVRKIPLVVEHAMLERGQERFDIFCSPCHGHLGDGRGAVVQRGFPAPPDYAIKRLQEAPVGHLYDVLTHGYGVMYPYGPRIEPRDRWAIVAYIRLLQKKRGIVPDTPQQQVEILEEARQDDSRPVRSPEQLEAESEPPAGEAAPADRE